MLPGGRRCLHSASTAAQACFHQAAGAADTGTEGRTDHVLLKSWYSECLQEQHTQAHQHLCALTKAQGLIGMCCSLVDGALRAGRPPTTHVCLAHHRGKSCCHNATNPRLKAGKGVLNTAESHAKVPGIWSGLPPCPHVSTDLDTARWAMAAAFGGITKTRLFISMRTIKPLVKLTAVMSSILLLLGPGATSSVVGRAVGPVGVFTACT